eukprot:3598124-Ditylum_brightwellii.AAC.1
MKTDLRSLKTANHTVRNRPLPIPFYVSEKKEKLSPSNYKVCMSCINPKDKQMLAYSRDL